MGVCGGFVCVVVLLLPGGLFGGCYIDDGGRFGGENGCFKDRRMDLCF